VSWKSQDNYAFILKYFGAGKPRRASEVPESIVGVAGKPKNVLI